MGVVKVIHYERGREAIVATLCAGEGLLFIYFCCCWVCNQWKFCVRMREFSTRGMVLRA